MSSDSFIENTSQSGAKIQAVEIVNSVDDLLSDPSLDEGAKFVLENESLYEPLSLSEQKRALRKLDWILIPCMFLTSTMGGVDKGSLSISVIFGLETDLNLVGTQYNWLSSILYIGSLVGMWPMSYLVQRYPTAKVLTSCALIWSSLTLLQCACTNFAGLATIRFFMGLFECVIVPGCSLLISVFYLKTESPVRTAIVFSFGSSIIDGGLASLTTLFGNSIPTWKYIYILLGSVSFVWSAFMVYFLPDSPINAKFLNTREKIFLVKRVVSNRTGVSNKSWKWSQVKETFLDPFTYLVMLFDFGINVPNGGLSTFKAIIIKNLSFTSVQSALMSMPLGVLASLVMFVTNYLAGNWKNKRCLLTISVLIVALVGSIVCFATPHSNTAAQLVGLYLQYFYFAAYVLMISCVQANTAGHTKKSTTYCFNYLGYCAGAITGSQTFKTKDAPQYKNGFVSMIVGYSVCIGITIVYWLRCKILNNQKRKNLDISDQKNLELSTSRFDQEEVLDLTDREQKQFFYTT